MKVLKRTLILAATGLAAVLSLTACGGGGGGGGTTTTSVSSGVLQKFGSVVVNGVEFKTTGAALHLRDDSVTPHRVLQTETEIQNHLKVGMVVTVKGRIDDNGATGTATEIEFRDTLKGRIDDKGVDFIKVMGQTVLIDDSIKSVLANLVIGNDVQVSALVDDKGGLRATHVEKFDGAELEAKGFVSGFTTGSSTFTLLLSRGVTSGITVTIGTNVTLPAGFANGAFVEVKTNTTAGNVITATKIELEDQIKAGENEKNEFEGFISSVTGDNLVINGQTVQTTTATRFVGGAKADLAVGMKVEVEGQLNANNILVASKVSFKDNFRINATATAVDPAAKTVTLLGKTIFFNSATEFKGSGSGVPVLADLLNQNVEVRGILSAANVITATRIDLKGAARNDAFIRGVVTAKTPTSSLTVAGIAINTSSAEFKDTNEALTSATAFFDAIVINTTAVKARWNPFSGDVTSAVKEVELEN